MLSLGKVMDAMAGAVTVSAAAPVRTSLEAVMVAVPGATAVTIPAVFTVAMLEADDDQVAVRPAKVLFAASRMTAVACAVRLTTNDDCASVTAMVATGAGSGEIFRKLGNPYIVSGDLSASLSVSGGEHASAAAVLLRCEL